MPTVIDLSALGTRGFAIQGDNASDYAGTSVSSAGDVNGDGFADVIVGATGAIGAGALYSGAAYVIFGKAGGFGPIDLTTLAATDGFIIQGDGANDRAGASVSSAGDVNNDGFDDLFIGAPRCDAGGRDTGAAYVIFGKANGLATIDVSALAPADGFTIQGDAAYDQAGKSVSSAGDVNGDGFADLIVGASSGSDGGAQAGEAYVIFGKAGGLGAFDLTGLAARPADGFVIQGDSTGDYAGFSVAAAGDVNGDGLGDLIVGAPAADGDANGSGTAYVIFGKASGSGTIDLTTSTAANGFALLGEVASDQAGFSVSSAGDVNGDGFDDLIVGANNNDRSDSNAGAAYVIFGKAGGFGPVDLAALPDRPANGFVMTGDAFDYAGTSVSAAGDVNGDGFADVIVGANGAAGGGAAYVVFGRAGGFGTVDLTAIAPADGFTIQGASQGDLAGISVSAAGDVNDDGFADVIVGAIGASGGGANAGAAYVVFGAAPTTSVTRIGSAIGQSIHGGAGDDYLDGRDGNDTLVSADGDDTLVGGAGNDTLDGGNDDDMLSGGSGADTLLGGAGIDTLIGGSGSDSLDGGIGGDTMNGGSGNDRYAVGSTGDRVIEDAEGGTDSVRSTISYTLGDNVENLTLGGVAAINGTGNALANTITGNRGVNTLSGGAGNDLINGGAGRDTLSGGTGADQFLFQAGSTGATSATADLITDFSHAERDRINLLVIDAIPATPARDPFHFVGATAFSGVAGELRSVVIGSTTYVQADTNGDRTADFMIRLTGAITLVAADFVGVSAARAFASADAPEAFHHAAFHPADLSHLSAMICIA